MSDSEPEQERRQPYAVSSFTAAEYGDLLSLLRKSPDALAQQIDISGQTPLHYAAQHNQIEAAAALIAAGCPINGAQVKQSSTAANVEKHRNNNENSRPMSFAERQATLTPLHRASFSGAVETMQLLLQHLDCDLLAQDYSFGDGRTPLHKAAAGGRPMAVQLLIQALQDRNLLSAALQIKDSQQATPLQVAQEWAMAPPDEAIHEEQSVARWNIVAGGKPDWKLCHRLLENLEETRQQATPTPIPAHLTVSTITAKGCIDAYLDPNNTETSTKTELWKNSLRSVLSRNVENVLSQPQHQQPVVMTTTNADLSCNTVSAADNNAPSQHVDNSDDDMAGSLCDHCGKRTIALYPIVTQGQQQRVCKACQKISKSRPRKLR